MAGNIELITKKNALLADILRITREMCGNQDDLDYLNESLDARQSLYDRLAQMPESAPDCEESTSLAQNAHDMLEEIRALNKSLSEDMGKRRQAILDSLGNIKIEKIYTQNKRNKNALGKGSFLDVKK